MERDDAPFNSYDLKTFLSSLITLSLRVTSSSSRGPSEEKKGSSWGGRHPTSPPHQQLQREGMRGNSLVVQWLGLHAFIAKGVGSIPGCGAAKK